MISSSVAQSKEFVCWCKVHVIFGGGEFGGEIFLGIVIHESGLEFDRADLGMWGLHWPVLGGSGGEVGRGRGRRISNTSFVAHDEEKAHIKYPYKRTNQFLGNVFIICGPSFLPFF